MRFTQSLPSWAELFTVYYRDDLWHTESITHCDIRQSSHEEGDQESTWPHQRDAFRISAVNTHELYIRLAAIAPALVSVVYEYASPGKGRAIPMIHAANALSSKPFGLGK
jgi:hypothetical protein